MMQNLLKLVVDFIFPLKKDEIVFRDFINSKDKAELTKARKPEFTFIDSLFSYKDPVVRELVWQIKYKKNKKAIEYAGLALYQRLLENKQRVDLILIPIPISKKRRKERGYNQCELLVNEIIRLDTAQNFIKNYNLLVRVKHIEHQTIKNRGGRLENIKGIFGIVGQIAKDSNIVIIDDVTTTGSTLMEAERTLLGAGYENITALTLAH